MEFRMDEIIADHYGPRTAETYDQMAFENFWSYAESLKAVAAEAVWAHASTPLKSQISILDIGAGTGNLSKAVVDEISKRARLENKQTHIDVTLFDSSPYMLGKAEDKLRRSAVESVNCKTGKIENADWGNSYDLIISSFAIHHLDGPGKKRCLQTLFDSLNTGGIAIVLDRMWLDHSLASVDENSFLRVAASQFFPLIQAKVPDVTLNEISEILKKQFANDGDQPSGVADHVQWFHEIGFSNIRSPYASFGVAVVSGSKRT